MHVIYSRRPMTPEPGAEVRDPRFFRAPSGPLPARVTIYGHYPHIALIWRGRGVDVVELPEDGQTSAAPVVETAPVSADVDSAPACPPRPAPRNATEARVWLAERGVRGYSRAPAAEVMAAVRRILEQEG